MLKETLLGEAYNVESAILVLHSFSFIVHAGLGAALYNAKENPAVCQK